MDIVSLKMVSGEEVIGRLADENAESVTLSKPMVFLMGPQGLGLVPYFFSGPKDGNVKIKNQFINAMIKTDADVGKQYQSQTSSLVI